MTGGVSIEKCPCGNAGCKDYHLVGIGSFCQGSGFTLEEAQEIVAALSARRSGVLQPVPEGWKPVPVEPTTAMLHAVNGNVLHSENLRKKITHEWQAMISAAPEPETS